MASAPLIYDNEGKIEWNKMWTNFCALAVKGGPPHRETKLLYQPNTNTSSEAYLSAVNEITRAYQMLTPYQIKETGDGWLQLKLYSPNMAKWFTNIINAENVETQNKHRFIYVPVGDNYTIVEIKNAVTVVAKAHHYWTHRTWFAKTCIHLLNTDLEEGIWE